MAPKRSAAPKHLAVVNAHPGTGDASAVDTVTDAGRSFRIMTIIGETDSGKSSLAKAIILEWMRTNSGPVIVADPGKNWKHLGMGEYPVEAYEDPRAMEDWAARITNNGMGPPGPRVGPQGAMIVMDDGDLYLPKQGNKSKFNAMWMINRHLKLDIIVISHRPQEIPLLAFAMSHTIVVFSLDEPHAKEYLSQTAIGNAAFTSIPGERGKALTFIKRPKSLAVVDYFKILPNYLKVDDALRRRFLGGNTHARIP